MPCWTGWRGCCGLGSSDPREAGLSFDAFGRYLTSTYRSGTTGRPLGPHAAVDYASRLRRLERLLQIPVEAAPPLVLRSLALGLKDDPRVTAEVPTKVIGDIAVALRTYAGFLGNPSIVATAVALLPPALVMAELQAMGFVAMPTTSQTLMPYQQNGTILYVPIQNPPSIIVHPALEASYSALASPPDAGPVRFHYDPALTHFPECDSGAGLVHFGLPFDFTTTADLRRFVAALQNALDLPDPLAPEKTLNDRIRDTETEATILSKARRGQGRFRADLLNFWRGQCALTGVSSPELLRASHIKPWSSSSNRERLDLFNGLLLAVHLDALFDRALITFQDSGEMLISDRMPDRERHVFGLTPPAPKLLLAAAHLGYLHHHRERFATLTTTTTPSPPPA